MTHSNSHAVRNLLLSLCAASACTAPAFATDFTGTLFFTTYAGGQNVWDIGYSYDDTTHTFSLGSAHNVASTNGADGIIFAPDGNLLVGGQGSGNVYEVNPSSGLVVGTQFTGDQSYHLALNPNNQFAYTSNFGGPLQTLNLPIGTGSTTTAITGGDGGVTQVAFGNNGKVFYVDGSPNGNGNLGTINLSTGVTTRLYSTVTPAHGLIYDPFTNLMTMFGAGQTGTMSASDGSGLKTSGSIFGVGDFDQGAVDGHGHALVAGSSAITFIDYSGTHDITNPNFTTSIGGFSFIDDVAPLAGAGSNPTPSVPEPGSLLVLGGAMAALIGMRRRSR